VGMGNDAEPDGDAGFPAASFSARAARKSALAEVGAAPVQAAENAGPRKVMGSSALAKMFKSWVDIKRWGADKNIKTSALATKTGSLEAEDEDDTGELVFGFFILFLPLIVLVIVLLVLLPFMIAKASGEPGPSMPSMPSVPGADAAAEHMKSASDMVVKYLSPVEEMSPFQVGQIHKLISDINENAGTAAAPGFIVLQVLFLLAFVGYMVVAIVALCLDWEAMVCDCAADSWIWLYVLLALAIPTTFGFIMGLVKAGLALADLKKKVGWEIPCLPGSSRPYHLHHAGYPGHHLVGLDGQGVRRHVLRNLRHALCHLQNPGDHVGHSINLRGA